MIKHGDITQQPTMMRETVITILSWSVSTRHHQFLLDDINWIGNFFVRYLSLRSLSMDSPILGHSCFVGLYPISVPQIYIYLFGFQCSITIFSIITCCLLIFSPFLNVSRLQFLKKYNGIITIRPPFVLLKSWIVSACFSLSPLVITSAAGYTPHKNQIWHE